MLHLDTNLNSDQQMAQLVHSTLPLISVCYRCFLILIAQPTLLPCTVQHTTSVLGMHYLPKSSVPEGSSPQDSVQFVFPGRHAHRAHCPDGQDCSQWQAGYVAWQQAVIWSVQVNNCNQQYVPDSSSSKLTSYCRMFLQKIPVFGTRELQSHQQQRHHSTNQDNSSPLQNCVPTPDPLSQLVAPGCTRFVVMTEERNHNMVHAVDYWAHTDPCPLRDILGGDHIPIVPCTV